MFIWGLNVVAIKFLVTELPPLVMQGARTFVAGVIATTVLFFLNDLRKLSKKEWLYVGVAAIFGQLGHHALLAIGLVQTTASNAGLILGLIPLATVIFTIIFFRERVTFLRMIGIFIGFAGVAIIVLQNDGLGAISRGDLFVFISMVSQAFSFIIIKKATTTISARQLTAVMLLIGSLSLLAISFFVEPQAVTHFATVPTLVWVVFFASAIIATGLGHILYNVAIQEIGAGETAIFNNLVPFFALIGSFMFLGETIVFLQIIGFLLIATGVILGTGYLELKLNKVKKQTIKETA